MLVNSFSRSVMLIGTLLVLPTASFAQFSVGISIHIAPPMLPVYVQPPCPRPNYLWTPGYWAWNANDGDYFWVPGAWVGAPRPGYLWTPGYWGWGAGGVYRFNAGYWGTHVGFYGGVNYGFGYGGVGFGGGQWRNGGFAYNTAVSNVNTTVIRNTYVNRTVINNNNTRTSFNGGSQGVAATPTPQERAYASQPRIPATATQQQHQQVASQDRSNFASVNHGVPAHAAVPRPVTNADELQHAAVPARTVAPTAHAAPVRSEATAHPANRPAPAIREAGVRPAVRAQSAAPKAAPKRPAAPRAAPPAKHAPHEPPKESRPAHR